MFKPHRLLPIVLSIILISTLLSPAALAAGGTGVIAASDAEGAPGDTVTVTITLQDNPGIIAAAMEVIYDTTQLKLLHVEDAELLNEPTFGASVEQYPYYLSWNDALASGNNKDTGLLVTMTFEILEDAEPGEVPVVLSGDANDLFNWDLDNVPFTFCSGIVTVTGAGESEQTPPDKPTDKPTDVPKDEPVDKPEDKTEDKPTVDLPAEESFGGRMLYDSFTDLAPNAWYRSSVEYMLEKGYMKGMSAATFAPDGSVTRAQLVTILYRAAGSPSVTGMYNPFKDVDASSWYGNAVIWGAANGVVKGVTDNTFAPNKQITREQLATLLFRYDQAVAPVVDRLAGYTDAAAVSTYAVQAMNWAVDCGIMNGTSDTTLSPQASATRVQTAALLSRYLKAATAIPVPTLPVEGR